MTNTPNAHDIVQRITKLLKEGGIDSPKVVAFDLLQMEAEAIAKGDVVRELGELRSLLGKMVEYYNEEVAAFNDKIPDASENYHFKFAYLDDRQ